MHNRPAYQLQRNRDRTRSHTCTGISRASPTADCLMRLVWGHNFRDASPDGNYSSAFLCHDSYGYTAHFELPHDDSVDWIDDQNQARPCHMLHLYRFFSKFTNCTKKEPIASLLEFPTLICLSKGKCLWVEMNLRGDLISLWKCMKRLKTVQISRREMFYMLNSEITQSFHYLT